MNNQDYTLYRVRLSKQYRDKAKRFFPSQNLYETYTLLVRKFLADLNQDTQLLSESRSNDRVSVWIDRGVSNMVVTRAMVFKVTPSRVIYTAIVLGLDQLQ